MVGLRRIAAAVVAAGAARTARRPPPEDAGDTAAVHVHRERDVGAPIESVFDMVRDIEWLPGWNPYLEVRRVSGPLDRVGTTFEATLLVLGLQFAGRGSVVAAEPRRLVHLHIDCPKYGGTSDWSYRFAPADAGTRCSIDIACEASGALALLDRLFGRPALQAALERIAAHQLDNIAALAAPQGPQPAC
jgi:carbon monoxide dehydrogenase subunit G